MPDPDVLALPAKRATPPVTDARRHQPSTIGGYALAIAKALTHYGVEVEAIFAGQGIPMAIGNDPMWRLPVGTMTALFRASVAATGDPYFGLTVARFIHISNLHALGYAMAASSTLMDLCKRVARYFHLVSQTGEVMVEEVGEQVILRCRMVADVCGETEDAFLGFLVLSMRQLHKAEFHPLRVELHHAMPAQGGQPYEQLFRSPVLFGVAETTLVLDRADLLQPLTGACPELAQHHDQIATGYLARLDRNDVIARLRHKIVEYLPDGECSRERLAAAMCMSETTLQNQLRRRGTTFHAVYDETRKEMACAYVSQSARSLTDIAFLLGFSDCSNFTRSFKRWTGSSPTAYRRGT